MKKTLIMIVACLLCVAGVSAATLSVTPDRAFPGDTFTFYGNAGVGGGHLYLTGPNLDENISVFDNFSHAVEAKTLDPGIVYTATLKTIMGNESGEEHTITFETRHPYVHIDMEENVNLGDPIVAKITSGGSNSIRVALYHSFSGQLADVKSFTSKPDTPIIYSFTPTLTGQYELWVIHPGHDGKFLKQTPTSRSEYILNTIEDEQGKRRYVEAQTYPGFIHTKTVSVSPPPTPTPTPTPVVTSTPTPTPTPVVTPTPDPTVEPTITPEQVEKGGDLKELAVDPTQEPSIAPVTDLQSDIILSELEELKRGQEELKRSQEEQKGILDQIWQFLKDIFGFR